MLELPKRHHLVLLEVGAPVQIWDDATIDEPNQGRGLAEFETETGRRTEAQAAVAEPVEVGRDPARRLAHGGDGGRKPPRDGDLHRVLVLDPLAAVWLPGEGKPPSNGHPLALARDDPQAGVLGEQLVNPPTHEAVLEGLRCGHARAVADLVSAEWEPNS